MTAAHATSSAACCDRPSCSRRASAFERGELAPPRSSGSRTPPSTRRCALQEEAGLDVVTDGEMRRLSFQSQLPAAVDGFRRLGHRRVPLGRMALGRGRRPRARAAADRGGRQAAAPALALGRGVRLRARADRPDPQGDAAEPEHALEPVGSESGRLPRTRASRSTSGTSRRSSARRSTSSSRSARRTSRSTRHSTRSSSTRSGATSTRAAAGPPNAGSSSGSSSTTSSSATIRSVTFGFHLCRGNQASRWLVSGGYDWLAERVFPKIARSGCCSSTTTSARATSRRSPTCRRTRSPSSGS